MEFGSNSSRGGRCRYRNLTEKMSVTTEMLEGLNIKRFCTFLSYFIKARTSSAAQRTAMYSRRSVVGEASLSLLSSPLSRRKFLRNHHLCRRRHRAVLIVLSAYVWPQTNKFVTSVHARCNFVDASFDTLRVQRGRLLRTLYLTAMCQPFPISYCVLDYHTRMF